MHTDNKKTIRNILERIDDDIGVIMDVKEEETLSSRYDTYLIKIKMNAFNFKEECRNYSDRGFIKRFEFKLGYAFRWYLCDEHTETISFMFEDEDFGIDRFRIAEKCGIKDSEVMCIDSPIGWIYSIRLTDYLDRFKVRL